MPSCGFSRPRPHPGALSLVLSRGGIRPSSSARRGGAPSSTGFTDHAVTTLKSHGRCTRLCLRAIGPLVTRGPAPHHPSALINGFSLLRRPRYSGLLNSSTKALYFTTK